MNKVKISKYGRKPKMDCIKKAQQLRRSGLKYREISLLMNNANSKSIWRWLRYKV